MKFIDELDVERVNQTLNFETTDCKITGGCDIFTTKPVASDKKLYKTIDHHLETILQENKSYKAAIEQQKQQLQQLQQYQSSPGETNGSMSPNINQDGSRRSSISFWEQKRRMSITDPVNSNNNAPKSSKLNDQNLKELVMNSESGYTSSSSIESNSRNTCNSNQKPRRTSSSSSLQSSKSNSQLRRSSLNDTDLTLNIGPFGPIREPASRRTFAYLIAILNASYPDHDFSSLEPTDFTKNSLKSFVSKFENSLYSLGKKPEEWIWEVINSHMSMPDCVVYQYNPVKSFLEDEPGYLWSLIGFLFNKKRKRVAFIYLICSRLTIVPEGGEFNEDSMKPIRQSTIDYNDGFEGEYDLVNDDENAIMDDSEDEF